MADAAKVDKNTLVDNKLDETAVDDDDSTPLLEAVDDDVFVKEEVTKNLDATQLYLGEIGFSPLLSAEEEVFFSRKSLKGCEASR
ncbi:sigma-70 factor domain-containing protein, partial [Pseudoalteromonas nigrifaciens]